MPPHRDAPHDTPHPAPDGPHAPARSRAWRSPAWWIGGGWVETDKAAAAFERMHRRDAIGDRIHLALALIAIAGLAGPTSLVELAYLPLAVFFFVRVVNAGPTWIHWLGQPIMLGALALALWQGLTLVWSGDVALGLDQIGAMRWVLVGVLIWPVIEHRRTLIWAFAIGVALGNGAQILHAIGTARDIEWMTWPRARFRNSGWWDPVVGGTVLTAALGVHLPAMVMGTWRARIPALALGGLCAWGVVATGTRGAWIASGGLIVVTLTVAFVRTWRGGHAKRAVIAAVAGACLLTAALAGAWALGGKAVAKRFDKAQDEIAAALEGDYASDTGQRIAMAAWAGRAIASNPIGGVGAGGFRAWVAERLEEGEHEPHDHAHNAPLQVGATTGLIGLALAAFIMLAGVRGGALGLDARTLGTIDAGPLFALIGLMLAGMFDAVHLNTQTAAVLGLMLGLCPCWRPGLRSTRPRTDPV